MSHDVNIIDWPLLTNWIAQLGQVIKRKRYCETISFKQTWWGGGSYSKIIQLKIVLTKILAIKPVSEMKFLDISVTSNS
jgi:hypothetical protein